MTSSTICDDFPALTGRQEPHHLSEFPGDDVHGQRAVKLAGRIARSAMPWQVAVLFAFLRIAADGMWTHPDCVLICPRQNGKTLILVLRCLYGLFKLNERIIYSAQRWPTAEDAYKRLWEIINRYPSLKRRVVKKTLSQGKGYLELDTGAQILFCTRSNDTGRGFDEVDLVIYDEGYNLTEGETAAVSPTQMASKNPQTIYASSAVNADQHPNGHVLAALRRSGLAGDPGLYLAEWMAPEDMPRESPATWMYANPSYGVIQTEVKVRKMMRGMNTPAGRKSFDVEILGRGDWPSDPDDVAPIIDPEIWRDLGEPPTSCDPSTCPPEMCPHGSRLVGPRRFAIEIASFGRRSVIAVVGRDQNGRLHGEIVASAPGSDWVVERYLELHEKWMPLAPVINARSAAVGIEVDLINAGVTPERLGSADAGAAFATFYQKVMADKEFRHIDQTLLNEHVAGAKTRIVGDGVAWDARDGADIEALLAVSNGLLVFTREESKVMDPMSTIW